MKQRTAVAAVILVAVAAAGLYLVFFRARSGTDRVHTTAAPSAPARSAAPREPAAQATPVAEVAKNVPPLPVDMPLPPPVLEPGAELPPAPDVLAQAQRFVAGLTRTDDNDLRESVRVAIGTGASGDYAARLRAVQALPPASDMAPEELAALYWFLASKTPQLYGSTAENAIKNDILTHLIKGGSPVPADALDLMLGVFNDSTQDRAWRDYVVQHLRFYVQQRWPDADARDLTGDAEFAAISNAYWAATRETETGLAGTALIGLEYLSRQYSAFDRAEVLSTAEALARSPDAKETVRATALQVCSLARVPDALPLARGIVRGAEAGVSLRVAAIATVGDLGGAGDVPVLEDFLAQDDARLQTAATAAIDRIKRRQAL